MLSGFGKTFVLSFPPVLSPQQTNFEIHLFSFHNFWNYLLFGEFFLFSDVYADIHHDALFLLLACPKGKKTTLGQQFSELNLRFGY